MLCFCYLNKVLERPDWLVQTHFKGRERLGGRCLRDYLCYNGDKTFVLFPDSCWRLSLAHDCPGGRDGVPMFLLLPGTIIIYNTTINKPGREQYHHYHPTNTVYIAYCIVMAY